MNFKGPARKGLQEKGIMRSRISRCRPGALLFIVGKGGVSEMVLIGEAQCAD